MLMNCKFFIVFPCGNRAKLKVIQLYDYMEYELSDYAVASRHHFLLETDAYAYAERLAQKHSLTLEPKEPSSAFLD